MQKKYSQQRHRNNSGMAIGPILMIIALLGILAAAIAAGSGSFSSGTTPEANITSASALIQIGENLKDGMDRILTNNNIDFNEVVLDVNSTNNSTDLFSASGGGITLPSTRMAADPANDVWIFPTAIMPGIGTGSSSGLPNRLAMLRVERGICDEINVKASAVDTSLANYNSAAIGDPANVNNDLGNLTTAGSWPTMLTGKPIGCISDTSNGTYWFYQVLAIQ